MFYGYGYKVIKLRHKNALESVTIFRFGGFVRHIQCRML